MAEIAETADVARATVFNYFGSKHALLEAITETVLDFWATMLDDALADDTTPTPTADAEAVRRHGEGHRVAAAACSAACSARSRASSSGSTPARSRSARNEEAAIRLVRLIERGQRRGELNDHAHGRGARGARSTR